MSDFPKYPKTPRLDKQVVITEKIDGTNALIYITRELKVDLYLTIPADLMVKAIGAVQVDGDHPAYVHLLFAGSRKRWITPDDDNFGFAAWVRDNAEQLVNLGAGHHYGEWWGHGIQRGYGLTERRFSLFNTGRWAVDQLDSIQSGDYRCLQVPECHVVPVLYRGPICHYDGYSGDTRALYQPDVMCQDLSASGSIAAPGFMRPEGIVVYHTAANQTFKAFCPGEG